MFTNFKLKAAAFGIAAGIALTATAVVSPAVAGGCGATCFMGGMMAGRMVAQRQEMQRENMAMEAERTQAMQQMAAEGRGGYGYGGYGGGYGPPPAYGYAYRRY